jgi:hypothetical protein
MTNMNTFHHVNHCRRVVVRGMVAAVLATAALAASSAPVVVTPGSLASYSFYPPAAGGGGGSGMQETLQTCYSEFSRGDRSLVMSTRDWTGQTKPITVFYKMVGGGTGAAGQAGSSGKLPQFQSGGGSSAILKNASVIASAPGMTGNISGAATLTPVSGSFTLAQADTLRIVVGGGSGAGMAIYQYTGSFIYSAVPGGAGSGWYGGGAGVNLPWGGTVVAGVGSATGGTASAGGAGSPAGGFLYGATNNSPGAAAYGAAGGSGSASGGYVTTSVWNGFMTMGYVVAGGGGGFGKFGGTAGDLNGGWYCPGTAPEQSYQPDRPTSFALNPSSGAAGNYFFYQDPASGSHACFGGGGRGQVVLQYQAPTCDLVPNWDQN